MFIYIKYGDGQHLLVNPNCTLIIFRNYLEGKLNIQQPDTVDLYDDQMNMKLLFRMKDPNENLENLFEPRGTYFACKIERNQLDNSFKSIVPLDSSANAELIDLLCKGIFRKRMDDVFSPRQTPQGQQTLKTQCVTLDHPKQKRLTTRRASLTPMKKGKATPKTTFEEAAGTAQSAASGKSKLEPGKKSGKGVR
ncbi:uncharacterized protein CXorf65 homolog [Stegostoma tigrinum]|uniref:uncharacterized protein CXorf65 homolog n=1 Tax=Stegostoma tigrinum TaxID=3053191 RepID=UPI00202B2829|nr:uncharacterized protein CXorf65 homolog [Stegostoma tigrinum]